MLARQEPYGWLIGLPGLYPTFTLDYRNVEQAIAAGGYEITPIYTRPAPAINLAEKVPDGFVMVPRALTAENGAKAALSGEFNLEYNLVCHECFGEGCDDCSGEGSWTNSIPVDWTTIKEIWAKGVEHFQAAAPEVE
ncbi:hypothetical protein [Pantoea piersonii]|uniref:hypothetical protein n=1 Tax=Pantoea piersonii TaxID=2364647 RepID=UPI0022F16C9B|nr:hypothetical protein [Pantoea piersonii]WBV23003.1 hypothetical protein PG877_07610 [Pantoea piersonii]